MIHNELHAQMTLISSQGRGSLTQTTSKSWELRSSSTDNYWKWDMRSDCTSSLSWAFAESSTQSSFVFLKSQTNDSAKIKNLLTGCVFFLQFIKLRAIKQLACRQKVRATWLQGPALMVFMGEWGTSKLPFERKTCGIPLRLTSRTFLLPAQLCVSSERVNTFSMLASLRLKFITGQLACLEGKQEKILTLT